MLREVKKVRQVNNEHRRWFIDDNLELILWYDKQKKLEGFQFFYDKISGTRTVTWKRVMSPDGKQKSTLISNAPYNQKRVLALVEEGVEGLDESLRDFILERLLAHGE